MQNKKIKDMASTFVVVGVLDLGLCTLFFSFPDLFPAAMFTAGFGVASVFAGFMFKRLSSTLSSE